MKVNHIFYFSFGYDTWDYRRDGASEPARKNEVRLYLPVNVGIR